MLSHVGPAGLRGAPSHTGLLSLQLTERQRQQQEELQGQQEAAAEARLQEEQHARLEELEARRMVEAGYRNKVGAAAPRGPQPRTAKVWQARGPPREDESWGSGLPSGSGDPLDALSQREDLILRLPRPFLVPQLPKSCLELKKILPFGSGWLRTSLPAAWSWQGC